MNVEAAWAAHDGTAVAWLFREDAVFTTPTFERSIGRTAIARAEQQAYDTYSRGTRVQLHVEELTPLAGRRRRAAHGKPCVSRRATPGRIARDDGTRRCGCGVADRRLA